MQSGGVPACDTARRRFFRERARAAHQIQCDPLFTGREASDKWHSGYHSHRPVWKPEFLIPLLSGAGILWFVSRADLTEINHAGAENRSESVPADQYFLRFPTGSSLR